jgi:zinc transport system ATP-binding protein
MSVTKHGTQGCGGHCCLKIEDLGVKIGASEILRNVNLHVHCGEIVALIGPNGAGKSTLIKSILGQREHQGKITFQPAGGRSRKFRIGYVPQSPSFTGGDPVSVLDLFSLCLSKAPTAFRVGRRQRETVLSCLSNVHGESLIDKKIGALSGGELQRVLLALALEPVPDILILDEPLSGVDVEGMHMLLGMLDEIRTKFDLSILIVTHDFAMLSRYVDKVVLLKETVLTQGTPEEVLSSKEFRSVFHMAGGEDS